MGWDGHSEVYREPSKRCHWIMRLASPRSTRTVPNVKNYIVGSKKDWTTWLSIFKFRFNHMCCDASWFFVWMCDKSGTAPMFLFKSKNCGLVAQFTSGHLSVLRKKERSKQDHKYLTIERRNERIDCIFWKIIPLADENFLVEDGAIWTKERSFDGFFIRNVATHVENLAASLNIGVVSYIGHQLIISWSLTFLNTLSRSIKLMIKLDGQLPSRWPLHLNEVGGILSKIG